MWDYKLFSGTLWINVTRSSFVDPLFDDPILSLLEDVYRESVEDREYSDSREESRDLDEL